MTTTWRLTVTLDFDSVVAVRRIDVESINYMEADDVVGDVLHLCKTRWPESLAIRVVNCIRLAPGDRLTPVRTP
jgi:hypothetical protein